jgi:hypothetical protein
MRAQLEATHTHLAATENMVTSNAVLVESVHVSDLAEKHERDRSIIQTGPFLGCERTELGKQLLFEARDSSTRRATSNF